MVNGMRAALVCIAVRAEFNTMKISEIENVSARSQNHTKTLKALKTADCLN